MSMRDLFHGIAAGLRDRLEGLDYLAHFPLRGQSFADYHGIRLKRGLSLFKETWWHQYRLESYASFRRYALLLDWALREQLTRRAGRDGRANRRLVVVRFGHLGDILHLMPSVREIRAKRPELTVELLTGPWNTDLLRSFPDFDRIHYFTPDLVQYHRGNRSGVRSEARERRFIQDVRGDGVGTVFCPSTPQLAEMPFIVGLSPHTYVGVEWPVPGLPVSVEHHTKSFNSRHYEMDAIADFLPAIGVERNQLSLRFDVPSASRDRIAAMLQTHSIREKDYIVVFPGSGWPGKCWPAERFAETIRIVCKDLNMQAVVAGAPSERALCEQVVAASGEHAINFAGHLSVADSAALIGSAKLLLGNDSAPVHFAAAMNVPSVSLWGPTFVEKWGPRGARHRCIRMVESCPCIYWHPCASCERGGACMKAISVEDVVRAIDELLCHEEPARLGCP